MKSRAPAGSTLESAFDQLWVSLMTTPVHLDSLLSKQTPKFKSILARIVPEILLRPVSSAEALGIGIPPGEPWSLTREQLANWRPARQLATRLHAQMAAGDFGGGASAVDYPDWMREAWQSDWGVDVVDPIADGLGRPAPLSLRAASQVGAEKLRANLTSGGRLAVRAARSPISPTGICLAGYAPILQTPAWESGQFEIQDEGSQIMAWFALWPSLFKSILNQAPGPLPPATELPGLPRELPKLKQSIRVVDACSGAGGKALAFADALAGKGRVFAYDTSAKKLQALRRRSVRADVQNIQTVTVTEGQESLVVDKFAAQADLVLVDAPCSGWGVLRRNPDIKWRQDLAALERMPILQLRLLTEYGRLVAPGGRLVFGVCTFRRAETLGVVESFLAANPRFRADEGGFLGPGGPRGVVGGSPDGFFMQAFTAEAKTGGG